MAFVIKSPHTTLSKEQDQARKKAPLKIVNSASGVLPHVVDLGCGYNLHHEVTVCRPCLH